MTAFHTETIDSFLKALGSPAPVPGGGGAAGLMGAQACALGEMVANLTISNKEYAKVAADAAGWVETCRVGRSIMLDLIDIDAENFNALMDTLHLPKKTEEEKKTRDEALQAAYKKAIEAPCQMADTMCRMLELFTQILMNGNKNVLTDSMIALLCAQASMRAAFLNIRINLKCIHDDFYCADKEASITEWENGIEHVDAILTYQVKI